MAQKRGSYRLFGALLALTVTFAAPAFAQSNGYTYDYQNLGVPKFVSTVYIDLQKITSISKFRSSAGHDYSDSTQFGRDGYKNPPDGSLEVCASMKHYFIAPDATTQIYAPVTGRVTRMFDEAIGGKQIQITSDEQPAFSFNIFHVDLNAPLAEGDLVQAGQNIGHHTGSQTYSDIAVFVRTPRGNHLISYFDTLTDEAFDAFRARGVESREQLQLSRQYRRENLAFSCAGIARVTPDSEYVKLTGGPATQTISVSGVNNFSYAKVGDAPLRVTATSTSGLPVTGTARFPKVCSFEGGTITFRRPGTCLVTFTQAGNAATLEAQPLRFTLTVTPQVVPPARLPTLGGVYPSLTSTTESYLLFHNIGGTAGTVTLSLFNGTTGEKVSTWTSPAIPSHASRQFQVDDLERAATAPFVKPAAWTVRVESATTAAGYMQHILFDRGAVAITNASSCDVGVTGTPHALPLVYSSLFEDFPSTIVFANGTASGVFIGATTYAADAGAQTSFGLYYPPGPFNTAPPARSAISLPIADLQTKFRVTPEAATSRFAISSTDTTVGGAYLQHVLESRRAGIVSDMNTACALNGVAERTIPSPLFTANAYSGGNVTAQSLFRFYNDGNAAAPVTVALRDPTTGGIVVQWTSPDIAPGTVLEVPAATVEAETTAPRKDIYSVTVDTNIDGAFQHVALAGGALVNFSSCTGATTVNGRLLLGVNSTGRASLGFESRIVVNNTGTEAAKAEIEVFDPRTGGLMATYTTDLIPANGQVSVGPGAIEARMTMLAGMAPETYIFKLKGAFTGYLQHFVQNHAAGVVTDLTAQCEM